MHCISETLNFPRIRPCFYCSTLFLAEHEHDMHCSEECRQDWESYLQVLQELPVRPIKHSHGQGGHKCLDAIAYNN